LAKKFDLSKSQVKKTDKKADFDRTKGEVLGLKLINKEDQCDDEATGPKEAVQIHKNLHANSTRFSSGTAAYFFDILSPLFEK